MSTVPPSPYASPDGPKKGMSGTLKIVLGILAGVGVLALLCCGVFGYLGFKVAKNVKFTADPAQIRAGADATAKVDVPAGVAPKFLMDIKNPADGKPITKVAIFANEQDGSSMLVGELAQGGDAKQMEATLRQSAAQQPGAQGQQAEVEVKESHHIDFQFRGKPATAEIGKGTQQNNNKEMVQGTATFETADGGHGIVVIQLPADKYKEADVEKIIREMK